MPDKPTLGNILDKITNMGENVTQQEKTIITMAKRAKSSEIQLTINPRLQFQLLVSDMVKALSMQPDGG
jgi:hypothetical protein